MYSLGVDLGSSSIKLSVLDIETGNCLATVSVPENEMLIKAPQHGWAEQEPYEWWQNFKDGLVLLKNKFKVDLTSIKCIGISYQMHGLVLVDNNLEPVRSSIIWCDSRAAQIGDKTYDKIGHSECQNMILGSPANFTASKLKWVKDNQPEIYNKAKYMMLPGDFIAMKLTGLAQTSTSGLSEAALWHFQEKRLAHEVLSAMDLSADLVPQVVASFGKHAVISKNIAKELGLCANAVVSYRAGDQANNALSLNVLNAGEIATTAGTSAVIYGVSSSNSYDEQNRINTFLHINNTDTHTSNGVLVCINGSGILYQWLRRLLSIDKKEMISYYKLNEMSAKSESGSKGLLFYPFGNGVERIFNNKEAFSGISNLNFNIHQPEDVVRAACEGIVFAMNYGFEIMRGVGINGKIVRAGQANLFLSPVFREIFANTTNTTLELYNTSGSEGAARGAAYGAGYYNTLTEAFERLQCLERIEPSTSLTSRYKEIYSNWKNNIK
ncbi:MAG: xylulokinase [Bacteroidales bacterium]